MSQNLGDFDQVAQKRLAENNLKVLSHQRHGHIFLMPSMSLLC
jgi:hypothetical protein